jgi:hypothetical protein
MSTSASIILKDRGQTVATIYKHWDGYIQDGLGDQLVDMLHSGSVAEGLGPDDKKLGEVYNGAGCLFASIVALLKDTPGDVYLVAAGSTGGDYTYTLDVDSTGKVLLDVSYYGREHQVLHDNR